MRSLLVFILFATCVFGQECAGCALQVKTYEDWMQPGFAIDFDWGDAKSGVCDAKKCEGAACDFSSVQITVTTPYDAWAVDGDWRFCPAGKTIWKYAQEYVACGGAHRIRIYKTDDEQSERLGVLQLACTSCEQVFEGG